MAERRPDTVGNLPVDRPAGREAGLPPVTSGAGIDSVAAELPDLAPSPSPPEPDDGRG